MTDLIAGSGQEADWQLLWEYSPYRLWSLWEMMWRFFPLIEIEIELRDLLNNANLNKGSSSSSYHENKQLASWDIKKVQVFMEKLRRLCQDYKLAHSFDVVDRIMRKQKPYDNYSHLFYELTHLDDMLRLELEKEVIIRIPQERINYYENDELFGEKVAAAFPSCTRDIRKAGSCYALGQEDACVHHLMLILERGLYALADRIGVTYRRTNWQNVIEKIASTLKGMPSGEEREFYLEVNAQFGFLKDAYRNHAEHVRDDPYDMEKALSIFNHVRSFMQELEKRGLSE
jgi:hypothetical protein